MEVVLRQDSEALSIEILEPIADDILIRRSRS